MPTDEVSASSLTKIYGKKNRRSVALDRVDFRAERGGITGILGLNGAGKSTLLKALAGAHYATSGAINVCGSSLPVEFRRLVGFVPESPSLDPRLTVSEILMRGAMIHGLSAASCGRAVRSAARTCGIEDVLLSRAGSLSKGYAQRVSLALALSWSPRVLILDEFSGGLDPAQQAVLKAELRKLSSSMTIILSTHHMAEAEELCSRIYILSGGRVRAEGSAEELISLCGASDLEDAFLRLTGNDVREETGNERRIP